MERMRQQLSSDLGVPIECSVDGEPFPVNRPVAHEIMMIAREAVQNAANHSSPKLVRMDLGFRDDNLALGVADDGCGFDPDALSPDLMRFGLIGMRERVAKLGGTLELKSALAIGTRITVLIPCNHKPKQEQSRDPKQ